MIAPPQPNNFINRTPIKLGAGYDHVRVLP
jgi:hypothetical protein